ncbi:MAG: chemotaxis protein CheW, partial [Spartobacteria bacterium]|nr:chemotaxis protein CheW [Spartobacteria bacterium]
MRTARIKGSGRSYYHCMSRVIERRFLLGDVEKEKFRLLMRDVEAFCGVRILTYSLMDNHFHLLVEVPILKELTDAQLVERVRVLYGKAHAADLAEALEKWHGEGDEKAVEELRGRYLYRMGDISEFMKTLKQRYTQWYNRTHNRRRGTLWEERFKSVMVEDRIEALATMAAYIDLNPVRAGLVSDPKAYRSCGYAEAVAGSRLARRGLGVIIGRARDVCTHWDTASVRYRQHLFMSGKQCYNDRGEVIRVGFDRERVEQVLAEGGKLTRMELLRCRVRYFTDGVVLGSKEFVDEVFREHRAHFSAKRKDGGRKMKQG